MERRSREAAVRAFAQHGIPLTTPAIELLPDLAGDWRADASITVEQLLAQVSGLRGSVEGTTVAALGQGPEVLVEAARLMVRAGNERAPGERWSYYNGNYFLVGSVLAAVTGGSFEQALDAMVCTPWGPSRTGFETTAAPITGWDEQTPQPVEEIRAGGGPAAGSGRARRTISPLPSGCWAMLRCWKKSGDRAPAPRIR